MTGIIGLALGAGAARGLAHIGVLRAFAEENIKADMICGTSCGALIGALYSAGVGLTIMEQIAMEIPRKELLDLSVPKVGFIKGDRIEALVKLLTRGMNIEELPIPFTAVAYDLAKGEKVIFDRGPIHRAVRASISIPCIFIPVYMDDRVLVDGALAERVPVNTLKEMGADITIGVDVGFSYPKTKGTSIFDVILGTIDASERELLKHRINRADVLLKLYLPDVDPYRFDQAEELSCMGYAAAKKAAPYIKDIIAEKKLHGSQKQENYESFSQNHSFTGFL